MLRSDDGERSAIPEETCRISYRTAGSIQWNDVNAMTASKPTPSDSQVSKSVLTTARKRTLRGSDRRQ